MVLSFTIGGTIMNTEEKYVQEKEAELQKLKVLQKKWEQEIEDLNKLRQKYSVLVKNLEEMGKVKEKMI